MTGSTLTSFDALLKERYYEDADFVEKLQFGENTLLGMLEKRGDSGMVGNKLPVPIITGLPQGAGKTFSVAQARSTATTVGELLMTAGDYHGVVQIGDKVLKASRTNKGAFLENKMLEIDNLWETCGENLSIYLWGNGGGALGRRESIAGNVITLTEPTDASNFEIGMAIVASANDGSVSTHAILVNSEDVTVVAVNAAIGTVEISDATDIGSFANGDYLFRKSDFFGDSGSAVLIGLQAFITATDSPMALWGVAAATRALLPQRWAGCRPSASAIAGKSIEERLKIMVAQMRTRFKSKTPDAFFMNPEDMQKLDTSQTSTVQRSDKDKDTKMGYEALALRTPGGVIPIYEDRHCPIGHAFGFRMKNHWMTHMDDLLHPQEGDGFTMLRKDASTDYEFRLLSYPIYVNNCPLNHGRVPLYD
jgi:hypothetical protein